MFVLPPGGKKIVIITHTSGEKIDAKQQEDQKQFVRMAVRTVCVGDEANLMWRNGIHQNILIHLLQNCILYEF